MEPGAGEVVEGVVERVVCTDRGGHTVLLLDTGDRALVKAAGTVLHGAQPGESLRLTGAWCHHPHRGRQFTAIDCVHTLPATVYAMRRYLASGLVEGIGPKLAQAIVAESGTGTMRVLEQEPQRLREVHLIGPGRRARIMGAWAARQGIREVMLLLCMPRAHRPRSRPGSAAAPPRRPTTSPPWCVRSPTG